MSTWCRVHSGGSRRSLLFFSKVSGIVHQPSSEFRPRRRSLEIHDWGFRHPWTLGWNKLLIQLRDSPIWIPGTDGAKLHRWDLFIFTPYFREKNASFILLGICGREGQTSGHEAFDLGRRHAGEESWHYSRRLWQSIQTAVVFQATGHRHSERNINKADRKFKKGFPVVFCFGIRLWVQLLLSPWPADQVAWSLDVTVAPAPFPILEGKVNCEKLNEISELTKNG